MQRKSKTVCPTSFTRCQMSGKNNLTYKVIHSGYFPFSLFKIKFRKLKSLLYCLPYAKAERIK